LVVKGETGNPVVEFCAGLRRLQQDSKLSRSVLAHRLGYSRSQLYAVLDGRISRPPEWDRLVEPLVRVCTGNDERAVAVWRQRHEVLVEVYHTLRKQHRQDDALPGRTRVVPAQLPASVDAFTGRANELAELDHLLAVTSATSAALRVFVISATAGVGKTALAVQWAHRVRHRFPDGQLYLNLRGYDSGPPLTPEQALDSFLWALDVPAKKIPLGVEAKAELYRSLLARRRMLVVLDNANTAEQVRRLLPGSSRCVVVVTSRSRLDGLMVRGSAHRIELDPVPFAEALMLLRTIIGEKRIDAELDVALTLIRQCAYLPLALRISAERVVSHPHTTMADLVGELADERDRLNVLVADDDEATAVRSVFFWSYRTLAPAVAQVFRLLGLHAGLDISLPAAAVLTGATMIQTRSLLNVLTSVHLLEETGRDRYRFHDLLRVYAAERAAAEETDETRATAIQRMLAWYLHTADAAVRIFSPPRLRVPLDPLEAAWRPLTFPSQAQAVEWCETELSNLVAATRQAAEHGHYVTAWKLPVVLWDFFSMRKHWVDWITIHQVGLAAARELRDRDGEGRILNSLGAAYRDLRRFEDAIDCFQQSLEIRREIGDQHTKGWILYNLGETYRVLGRFAEAIDYFHQALLIGRKAGERWGEGWVLTMLGDAYRGLGRFAEAIDYLNQALMIREEIGDQLGKSRTLNTLGTTYHELGRFQEAIDYLNQARKISHDDNFPGLEGHNLSCLGDAYREIGQLDTAQQYWRQALVILDNLGDPLAAEVRARLAALHPENRAQILGCYHDLSVR
jgi:tetratricopeptide (TPR) repeat protein